MPVTGNGNSVQKEIRESATPMQRFIGSA